MAALSSCIELPLVQYFGSANLLNCCIYGGVDGLLNNKEFFVKVHLKFMSSVLYANFASISEIRICVGAAK